MVNFELNDPSTGIKFSDLIYNIQRKTALTNKEQLPIIKISYKRADIGSWDFMSQFTIKAENLIFKDGHKASDSEFVFTLGLTYINSTYNINLLIISNGSVLYDKILEVKSGEEIGQADIYPNQDDEILKQVFGILENKLYDFRDASITKEDDLKDTHFTLKLLNIDDFNNFNFTSFPHFELYETKQKEENLLFSTSEITENSLFI